MAPLAKRTLGWLVPLVLILSGCIQPSTTIAVTLGDTTVTVGEGISQAFANTSGAVVYSVKHSESLALAAIFRLTWKPTLSPFYVAFLADGETIPLITTFDFDDDHNLLGGLRTSAHVHDRTLSTSRVAPAEVSRHEVRVVVDKLPPEGYLLIVWAHVEGGVDATIAWTPGAKFQREAEGTADAIRLFESSKTASVVSPVLDVTHEARLQLPPHHGVRMAFVRLYLGDSGVGYVGIEQGSSRFVQSLNTTPDASCICPRQESFFTVGTGPLAVVMSYAGEGTYSHATVTVAKFETAPEGLSNDAVTRLRLRNVNASQ